MDREGRNEEKMRNVESESLSISFSFSHSLSIFSQPGCQNTKICATLIHPVTNFLQSPRKPYSLFTWCSNHITIYI